MPKSYSEQEKEYIKKRLKEEAAKCLVQYGVRRTTVDEIVKRVHIPKGTFYLFYKSKELFLFEAIQEQHEMVNRELYKALSNLEELSAEKLTLTIKISLHLLYLLCGFAFCQRGICEKYRVVL